MVATALESLRDPDRLEELAYHYAEAAEEGVADKALFYSQRAAEKAVSLMACEDAVAHYNRALTALRLLEGSDPELSCELLLAQAEAAWGTLEQAEAVQQRFVRAANSARAIGSGTLLARAALGRTGYGAGPGGFRDLASIDLLDIELLTEASGALGNQPSKLKALVLSRLGLAVIKQQPPLAIELAAEAQTMAERLADPETLAWVLRYRHEVISGPDFVHERLVLADGLLRLARQVGCRPLELDALHFVARDYFELADIAAASRAAMAAAALSATMRHLGAHSAALRAACLIDHARLVHPLASGRTGVFQLHPAKFQSCTEFFCSTVMAYTVLVETTTSCASSVSKAKSGHSTAIGKRARALPSAGPKRQGANSSSLRAIHSAVCRATILSSPA